MNLGRGAAHSLGRGERSTTPREIPIPRLPRLSISSAALSAAALFAGPATASFHLMQIEQVIGGVCGDTAAQAIQLRMRAAGQNLVDGTTLVAYDATGANPIVLLTLPGNVAGSTSGARILLATGEFATLTGQTPDFDLAQSIPPSYLEAGRLTFQLGAGVYWSLAWGGATYTGSTTGLTVNDPDGDFGPPFPGPLPRGQEALAFQGTAPASSSSNDQDYALTQGGAVFTDNSGLETDALLCPILADGFESGTLLEWSSVEPPDEP